MTGLDNLVPFERERPARLRNQGQAGKKPAIEM